MKKLFAILIIAFVFTACNSGSPEKTETTKDSANSESPLMDAMNTADSANKEMKAGKDTAAKLMEEVKEPQKH